MKPDKDLIRLKSGNPVVRTSWIFFMLFIMTMLWGMTVLAQENQTTSANQDNGNIINLYGRYMGNVDDKGNVTNTYGTFLGTVDIEGNIFNVSKINIGRVGSDGQVFNQSGTVLGSVNNTGEIFNVSGRKMGEVIGEKDIKKTGAAARLIVLK